MAKPKTCVVCKQKFEPKYNTAQRVCSPNCAYVHARKKEEEKEKKRWAKKKREHRENDRGFQKKKAQAMFNKYIRLRDRHLPCISCGTLTTKQWDAGHFKTVGGHSDSLAFDEDNCHKQCSHCNNFKSGAIDKYRVNLIEKIGKKRVLALDKYRPPRKFTAQEFLGIYKKYFNKVKSLEKGD